MLSRGVGRGLSSVGVPSVVALATPSRSFTPSRAGHKKHQIVSFDGDGVGPELISATKRIIARTGVHVEWIDHLNIGFDNYQKNGAYMTEEHLKQVERYGIVLKGPLTIDAKSAYVELRGRKFTSANQVLRKVYQLHANIRPAKGVQGMSRYPETNCVIVRENTEDLYTGEERWVDKDTVECIKRISRGASTKIAVTAFEYARTHKMNLVTAVHKANVCKQTDGLFLTCARVRQLT
eukprot:g14688.t1